MQRKSTYCISRRTYWQSVLHGVLQHYFTVADPHHLDADPDPSCLFDVDPDPDPACHFDADANTDSDPDPSFQVLAQNLEKVFK